MPFHIWTPDVYQGAPTPVTAFMASAREGGGFAGLLRVFVVAFAAYRRRLAAGHLRARRADLLVGSVLAVVQTDVKRMLAYSSISHAGFILVGVAGGQRAARRVGALFYLPPTRSWCRQLRRGRRSSGARATATTRSTTTAAWPHASRCSRFVFTLFLLAQAGVPLTVGFVAKFYVIDAAVEGALLTRWR